MSQNIDADQVRKVAKLARLDLGADEIARMATDLGAIVEYVAQLDELELEGVPVTSHAVELPTHLRPDTPEAGLPVEVSLRGAPEPLGQGFGVPKIIE